MCAEVIRAVEQFLYREARLLDERRFHDWLELFTDDLRYWMPVRTSRYPKGSQPLSSSTRTGTSKKSWHRQENWRCLTRPNRASADASLAWIPVWPGLRTPPRTRHLITNIEVEAGSRTLSSQCTRISSCTGPGQRRSKTSSWAGGSTSSERGRLENRSP